MTLGNFGLQFVQRRLGRGDCLGADFRVHRCLGRLGRHGLAPCGAQGLRPYRHGRQRRSRVQGSGHRHLRGRIKSVGYQGELAQGGVQHAGEFHIDAGPARLGLQFQRLRLPVRHIGMQSGSSGLRFLPGLGRQNLDTLRQQNRRFALDLGVVLQVLNGPHPLRQLDLECGQRLFAQRGAGLGRITLPGHGIGHMDLSRIQQGLRAQRPLGHQLLLAFGAAGLVQPFFDPAGRPLVLHTQFLEHGLLQLSVGVACQPLLHPGRAFAGGGRAEGTPRDAIELGDFKVFGGLGWHVLEAGLKNETGEYFDR